MDAILIIALITAPALAAIALFMTAYRTRRGFPVAVDARRLAFGQAALMVGIAFWLRLATTPDLGAPWGALVAVGLAIVAIVASQNPLKAGAALWTLAIVFPAVVLAVIALRYLLSDGYYGQAGDMEPMSEMVVVALMATVGSFSGPAYSVGSLFGVGEDQKPVDHSRFVAS